VANGAQNLSAMYIPPLPVVASNNFTASSLNINSKLKADLASSFAASALTTTYPSVLLEACNYAYPSRGLTIVDGAEIGQAVTEIDFEIPFMSFLETVGGVSSQDAAGVDPAPAEDLGTIVMSYLPTIKEPTSAGEPNTEPQTLKAKIFLGCDDFTRFGMQTFTTPLTVAYTTGGTNDVLTFNATVGGTGSFNPSAQAPRAWFTAA